MDEYSKLTRSTIKSLVELFTSIEEYVKAESYLSQFDQLSDKEEDFQDRVLRILTHIFYLIHHPRPLYKLRGQELVRELLDEIENIHSEYQIQILGYFAKSLVFELQNYNSPEIRNELTETATKLSEIADRNNLIIEQIEILELFSKIEIIRGNVEDARKSLLEAIDLAEKHGYLDRLERLREQMDLSILQNLMSQSTSDLIQTLDLDSVLSRLITEKGIEAPITKNEIPITVLILNQGGSAIYDKDLSSQKMNSNETLIGAFISAITSFGDQLFKNEQRKINRIEHGDHTILSRRFGEFTFVYVFKGAPYRAVKRFEKMENELKKLSFLSEQTAFFQKLVGTQKEIVDDVMRNIFKELI